MQNEWNINNKNSNKRMKRNNYIHRIALAAGIAVLAACTADNDTLTGDTDRTDNPAAQNGEIRFEITFAPATRVSTSPDALFLSTWEDGDEIGIFAYEADTILDASIISNAKLTYSSANGGTWTPDQPLYWPPGAGIKLAFAAYHPYDPAATNPVAIAFSVATDQNATTTTATRPAFNRSHLLSARADNSGRGYTRGDAVPLAFAHALAMIEVKVGDNMPAVSTVSLDGCVTDAVLDLADGTTTLTPAGATPRRITMYACPAAPDASPATYAYRALVPAQTVAAGTALFRFQSDALGQQHQSPRLAADLTLVQGRAETFNFSAPSLTLTLAAGSDLARQLADTDLAAVTRLTLLGEMTQDDFYFIRDRMPNLTRLDLGGATVTGSINLSNGIDPVQGNAIPYRAFYEKTSLKEFVFPRGITAIGNEAFTSSGLTGSLTIPGSVRTIDNDAFRDCTGLTGTLTISQGVEKIGSAAFEGCSGFTGSLTIPGSVRTIGSFAFKDCSGFNGTLTISQGVQSIGGSAFWNCSGFTGLTIPASITEIGDVAFGLNLALQSITCRITDLGAVQFGENGIFEAVNPGIPVHVPEGQVDTYRGHPAWSQFENIEAIPTP